MRIAYLFLSIAFVLTPKNILCQNSTVDDFVFQDLDQSLLKIWIGGKSHNLSGIGDMYQSSFQEWNIAKKKLQNLAAPHVNIEELIDDVNYYFKILKTSIELEDYSNVEKLSYHIIYEFRSIRQCYYSSAYVLDKLWDVIDVYTKIDFTIDDPMMDLKEWNEFEDLINKMICNWEGYDVMHIDEIQHFFPGMNKYRHVNAKEQVSTCIYSLLIAIESAFQDRFKLPCDQLGEAFVEIIQLYAYAKPSGLI